MVNLVPMSSGGGVVQLRDRRSLEQLALIELLGNTVNQGVKNYQASQDRAQEQQDRASIVSALRQDTPGQATEAQLDPTKMTVGSAAGTLPGMPGAPGRAPTLGLSEQEATAALLTGVAPDLLRQRFGAGGEGFSLSAGEVRYDAAGNPIAAAPREAPDLPSSVREAQAMGFDLSTPEGRSAYQQHRQNLTRPPAGTTVNIPAQFPAAPAGFHYEGDLAGGDVRMVRTPGGPAEAEAQEREVRAAAKQASAERQMRVVSRETGRVLDVIEDPDWTGGAVAYGLARLPGTDAYQAQKSIDTLGAIIGFDTLQRMRDQSPTGGALGSITEGEIQRLQSVHGSLDIAQDPAVLAENLTAFEQELSAIVHGTEAPSDGGRSGTPGGNIPMVQDATAYEALPSGAEYTVGDGQVRRKP